MTADSRSSPRGPFVYFPEDDWYPVTRELLRRHPPGTLWLGTNRSKWKTGHWYVWGDVEIAMEEIVRSAVEDGATVEVVPRKQAVEMDEKSGDRRRGRLPLGSD